MITRKEKKIVLGAIEKLENGRQHFSCLAMEAVVPGDTKESAKQATALRKKYSGRNSSK